MRDCRREGRFGGSAGLSEEAVAGDCEPLLEQVMSGGRRVRARPTMAESRQRFQADLALLPEAACQVRSPKPPAVKSSDRLKQATNETRARVLAQIHGQRQALRSR